MIRGMIELLFHNVTHVATDESHLDDVYIKCIASTIMCYASMQRESSALSILDHTSFFSSQNFVCCFKNDCFNQEVL